MNVQLAVSSIYEIHVVKTFICHVGTFGCYTTKCLRFLMTSLLLRLPSCTSERFPLPSVVPATSPAAAPVYIFQVSPRVG